MMGAVAHSVTAKRSARDYRFRTYYNYHARRFTFFTSSSSLGFGVSCNVLLRLIFSAFISLSSLWLILRRYPQLTMPCIRVD